MASSYRPTSARAVGSARSDYLFRLPPTRYRELMCGTTHALSQPAPFYTQCLSSPSSQAPLSTQRGPSQEPIRSRQSLKPLPSADLSRAQQQVLRTFQPPQRSLSVLQRAGATLEGDEAEWGEARHAGDVCEACRQGHSLTLRGKGSYLQKSQQGNDTSRTRHPE